MYVTSYVIAIFSNALHNIWKSFLEILLGYTGVGNSTAITSSKSLAGNVMNLIQSGST